MRHNFEKVQPWILAYEGGYVDHPKDPGGATMEGVTQATYDAARRRSGLPLQHVRKMKPEERDAIYKTQYWDKISGDDLPDGVDAAVYDYAVNSGPSRAAKELQSVLGIAADGVIGLRTLDAVSKADAATIIKALCERRLAFLKRLKIWPTFGKGWTRRVIGSRPGVQDGDTGIIDRAMRLARGRIAIPAPKIKQDGASQKTPVTSAPSFWAGIVKALAQFFQRKT